MIQNRSVKVFFVFSFIFFGTVSIQTVHSAPGDAYDWSDYDNYIVIDHDTTWGEAGKVRPSDWKPVVIVNEAVLTIVPGSTIEINQLNLFNGRIVAEGTEAEPIHFTKRPINYAGIPADYAPFDRECFFLPETGMIRISLSFVDFETIPSVFHNVIFEGMGTYGWYGSNNCPSSLSLKDSIRNFLVKTVNASHDFLLNPALKVDLGKVQIDNATFKNNAHADIEMDLSFSDSWLKVTNSNFESNTENTAVITNTGYNETRDFSDKVLLKNNWYGSPSGPTTEKNPGGTGEKLIGSLTLDGFSDHEFSSICTENCFSNVLFLPGLEASRLSTEDKQVWEPKSNADAEKLVLDTDGKSVRDDISTKDVIDNAYFPTKGNIYKSFLADLEKWKSIEHLIADYAIAPYDWRLSLDDIVNNGIKTGDTISYRDSTDTPYIIGELRRLAGTSKSGKVTLIAHSNGGLVVKALVQKLGNDEAVKLIDKVVFVAVPQSGTPQAVGAILHGYDQGLPVNWLPFVFAPKTARVLAQNMSSTYNLLPSNAYFSGEGSGVTTPLITFDPGISTQHYIDTLGESVENFSELQDFLRDDTGKVSADSSDTTSPSTINTHLLSKSNDVQSTLDTFSFPSSIPVYQIAGFGAETLGTIRYWTEMSCAFATTDGRCMQVRSQLAYTPEMVVDGDGTVVVPSALAMNTNDVVKRYWVDLKRYDTFYNFERKHADILEIPELRDFLKQTLTTQSVTNFPKYLSDSEPSITSEKRLRYYLHSPLTLSIQDASGHETSGTISTIPGARYKRFGEVQYISVPAEVHPTVLLDGTADGSFTLEVQETENDVVTATTLFTGIPNTAHTRATMIFSDGTISHAGPFAIDYDGDGTDDHSILPVLDGTAMLQDTTSPTTTLSSIGTIGTNDWYTSDVTVTLSALDDQNGSGIAKTEYSLDNGTNWTLYTDPFTFADEGTTTIQYFSTDTSGNTETVQTKTIKIDKTAPEAKIFFNPDTQKLDIIGIDTLGEPVSVVSAESVVQEENKSAPKGEHWYDRFDWNRDEREKEKNKGRKIITTTLTDQAGHITSIVFEEKENDKNNLKRNLQSISYDGVSMEVRDTSVQYEWQKNWRGIYTSFTTQLKVSTMNLESNYSQKKNETWITKELRESENKDNEDDSKKRKTKERFTGMIIPSMMTEKGEIKINY